MAMNWIDPRTDRWKNRFPTLPLETLQGIRPGYDVLVGLARSAEDRHEPMLAWATVSGAMPSGLTARLRSPIVGMKIGDAILVPATRILAVRPPSP